MARNITALQGQESLAAQFPISLVRLEIPTYPKTINDSDVSVWLNPTTNATAMSDPGGGTYLRFDPYAGLQVPQIELTAETIVSEVSIEVENVNEEWFTILMANQYREKPATIWQGNLVVTADAGQQTVVFQGAIRQWTGRIEAIETNRQTATISLSALTNSFAMTFPYRTYTQTDFPQMPKSGASLKWGYSEEEV